jgi:hypothetical protein
VNEINIFWSSGRGSQIIFVFLSLCATASNTILLEGKPDTPEYVYVHNIEVNLLGDNTVDDYNHLGDIVSNEIKPSPVYDQAEGQENEYNLTASSRRPED